MSLPSAVPLGTKSTEVNTTSWNAIVNAINSIITWATDYDNAIYTDGSSVSIDNSSPLAPLHVGDANVNNSTEAIILISRNFDDDSSGNGHAFSDSSQLTRSGGVSYNSFDARININGTVDYGHYAGFQYAPTYNSSGTLTYSYGLYTTIDIDQGIVDKHYGHYAADPTGAGTLNYNYGLYVPALVKGGHNYAIWTDSLTPSYFGGNVWVSGSLNGCVFTVGNQTDNSTTSTLQQWGKSSGGVALSTSWILGTGGLYYLDTQTVEDVIVINTVTGAIQLGYNTTIGLGTAGVDYTLTFNGADNDGVLTWMEDEDYFKFSDDIFMNDGENIIAGATTGTKLGIAASEKWGFFGATPVVQRTKAGHNNWATLGDVVNGLVELGFFDIA